MAKLSTTSWVHPTVEGRIGGMTEQRAGTVGKALEVLDQVAACERPVRFSELLADSPHAKATLYRFLQTLTRQGMLNYDSETQTYSLGLRLVRLAHSAWEHSSLAPVARPYVDKLVAEVGEAIHLAQMDNGQVLFIDKRKSTDMFETLARTGRVAPAYCTGVGKAILAFSEPQIRDRALRQQAFVPYTPSTHQSVESLLPELDDIRVNGIAFDREEHERGIISIAAPIMSRRGRLLGAISIATAVSRHSLEGLEQFRQSLLQTAENIAEEAVNWQFPDQYRKTEKSIPMGA